MATMGAAGAVGSHPGALSDQSASEDEAPMRTAVAAAAAAAASNGAGVSATRRRRAALKAEPRCRRAAAAVQPATSSSGGGDAAAAPTELQPRRRRQQGHGRHHLPPSSATVSWASSLRSLALLALLVAGPIALLARNASLVVRLSGGGGSLRHAVAGTGPAAAMGPLAAAAAGRPGPLPSTGRGGASSLGVAAAAAGNGGGPGNEPPAGDLVRMIAVVADDKASPLTGAGRVGAWGDVARHMADRLRWTDPRFALDVVSEAELAASAAAREALRARLASGGGAGRVAVFTALGVADPAVVDFLSETTAGLPTALFWDCAPRLAAQHRADGFAPAAAGPLARLLASAGASSSFEVRRPSPTPPKDPISCRSFAWCATARRGGGL